MCHNLRRYANKVFAGLTINGKGTMGWRHGYIKKKLTKPINPEPVL